MSKRTKTELHEAMQAAVKMNFDDAHDYMKREITPTRQKAQRYYDAEPFGNEGDGTSEAVVPLVRDKVQQAMATLVDLFTTGEKVMQFSPRRSEDVASAEQATQYGNYVLTVENDNWQEIVHSAIWDALVLKTGWTHWYWDETVEVTEATYTGKTVAEVQFHLLSDPEVELVDATIHISEPYDPASAMPWLPEVLHQFLPPTQVPMMPPGADPMGAAMGAVLPPPDISMDVTVRRTQRTGRIKIDVIPPEEVIVSRYARNLQTAPYIARVMRRTVSDLVALGYDQAEVEDNAGAGEPFQTLMAETRNPGSNDWDDGEADPSQRQVVFGIHWMRFDSDDDGIAELHCIHTVGDHCHVLHSEMVSKIPMSVWLCKPRPHMLVGDSMAEHLFDLQERASEVMRGTLDSLVMSMYPRMAYAEQSVNAEDVANLERGALIRVDGTQIGDALKAIEVPFAGAHTMPMMAQIEDEAATRTGITPASMGLDVDALQSTTKSAADATISGAQAQQRAMARSLAESGMRPLARGVLELMIQHSDRPKQIRLANEYVEVDPRTWNAEMDVSINIALGRGSDDQRAALLKDILALQTQMMQAAGMQNPVVSLKHVRNTIDQLASIGGLKDISPFFSPITPEIEQQLAAPPQDKPTPEQVLAEAEIKKAEFQMQARLAELELDRQKMMLEHEREVWKMRQQDDRERDKQALEFEAKRAENAAKYGAQINEAYIRSEVERDRHAGQEMGRMMREGVPDTGVPPMGAAPELPEVPPMPSDAFAPAPEPDPFAGPDPFAQSMPPEGEF